MSNLIQDVLGDDYKPIKGSEIATVKNGRVAYIDLDINKPGKFFFDLTDVFNATVGEAEKEMSLRILRNGQPLPLNNYKVQTDGQYPSGEDWHVTGANLQSNSPVTTFTFPLGLFQEVGEYPFQFTITNTQTGDKETSHWCLFNVTQSATTLGIDWANGVNPFDSDYTKWKTEVSQWHTQEQEYMAQLSKETKATQDKIDAQAGGLDTLVDAEVNNKMGQPNTWGGLQTFKNGIEVEGGIKYHAGLLADKGNDLESGLIVHDGVVVAKADGSGQATVLNGVGNNSSNHGYISFDVFSGKDYKGVSIHANCKIPKSAIGKPLVQFSKNMGFDQTPFVLGDYIVQFNWSSNTLDCLAGTTSSPNETVMDIKTIL